MERQYSYKVNTSFGLAKVQPGTFDQLSKSIKVQTIRQSNRFLGTLGAFKQERDTWVQYDQSLNCKHSNMVQESVLFISPNSLNTLGTGISQASTAASILG